MATSSDLRDDSDQLHAGESAPGRHTTPTPESTQAGIDQAEAFVNDPKNHTGSMGTSRGSEQSGQNNHQAGSSNGMASHAGPAIGSGNHAAPAAGSGPAAAASKAGTLGGLPGASKGTPGSGKPWYARRRNQAGVGGIIATVIILIGLYILYIPFEIIHIAQVLWHHHGDRNQRTEDRAEEKVWQKLFGEKETELGGYKFQTGHIIADKFHNTALKNLDARFENAGVELVWDDTGKNLIGVRDIETGDLIKDFQDKNIIQKNALTFKTIVDHIGTKNPILLAFYTKMARVQFGVSFKFWTERAAKVTFVNILQKIWSKVGLGAAGDTALNAESEGADKTQQQELAAQADNVAGVGEAAQATADEFNNSFDMKKALAKGKAIFANKWFKTGGIGIGIVTFYCMIQGMVNSNLDARTTTLTDRLIRVGDMLQTQAHQLMAGNLYATELNDWMKRLEGDPNADPNTSEDAKDFTQSCSWKRALDEPCSTDKTDFKSYNPDLTPDANPSPGAISATLAVIQDLFNIPGSSFICSALNSVFGWVIQGIALIASVITGPISAVVGLLQGALLTYAIEHIVPIILKMVTNLSVTGTENPVGLMNEGSAGTALSIAALARSTGDIPLNPNQLATLNDATSANQAQLAIQKGWTYRTFSLDNTNSIASRLMDKVPMDPQEAVADISGSIQNLLPNLATVFGSIAFGLKPALAATNPGQCEFGFACFGTMDSTIDQYSDPIANENVLAAPITKPDGTVTSRLEMLGDPSTYKPDQGDLPHQGLLYCFVNKYVSPPSDPNGFTDPICKDLDVLTPTNPNKTTYALPNENDILNTIYCQQNNVCGLPWEDDFNRYRMEIKYYLMATAIYGYTIDGDPWASQ